MNISLIIAFIINLSIVLMEIWVFSGLRKKTDIFKYYTYLQNALSLVVSFAFSVCLLLSFAQIAEVPGFLRGLRYIVTTGLLFTTVVYFLLLSSGGKNAMTKEDFLNGYNPAKANAILHMICPIASLISFTCFERSIPVSSPAWTACAAIPSCAYWVVYGFLSITRRWEEPYDFQLPAGRMKHVFTVLLFAAIPAAYMVISYVLWNIR